MRSLSTLMAHTRNCPFSSQKSKDFLKINGNAKSERLTQRKSFFGLFPQTGDEIHLWPGKSMRFPSQNLASPSNTCANYCLLLGSPFLDFIRFYNTFETVHQLDQTYGDGCAKRYVFQVENHRSWEPMISFFF